MAYEEFNDHDRLRTAPLLAGKSTLNRLELGAAQKGGRYRKINADPADDPIHGNQEGRFYQGYYRNHCYLPLYCLR